jgi:tetratricopeptide (TPR) repeat protein
MSRHRFLGAVLLGLTLLGSQGGEAVDTPPESSLLAASSEARDLERIRGLFRRGSYAAVVEKSNEFIARYSGESTQRRDVFALQGQSLYRLGQLPAAIRAYESALALMPPPPNVGQRPFVPVMFRLAVLLREAREFDRAFGLVEKALRLDPYETYLQILYGQLLLERGQREQGLKHFLALARSSVPVNEERAVVAMKLDRLDGRFGASVTPPDLRMAPFYPGISIGLFVLNDLPLPFDLEDICVVLSSKWLIGCEVLPDVTIDETDILTHDRNQYDGPRVLAELDRRVRVRGRHRHLIAVTGRDVVGSTGTSVHSWQLMHPERGTGVISTAGFTELHDFYEGRTVSMRRLAIGALSATGSMLGFTPPMDPECPTALSRNHRGFLQKRSRLCEPLVEERDRFLAKHGGAPVVFGEKRNEAAARVYRAYYLD